MEESKSKAENSSKLNYTKEEIIKLADAAVNIDWVNRDPNFLYHEQDNPSESELNVNPWCNALKDMCKYYQIQQKCDGGLDVAASNIFHVDIHGKQNDGVSDLDLGLYCIALDKRQKIREALSFELNKIFKDTEFKVNAYPARFGGNWGQHFITLMEYTDDVNNTHSNNSAKKFKVKKVIDKGVHPSRLIHHRLAQH